MSDVLAVVLGGFLIVVGVTHFAAPSYFDRLVPPWLPATRLWVLASGGVEILLGGGLLHEPTRPLAAWAATGLFAAYVATHVDALVRARADHDRLLDRPAGAIARVVVNLGYLAWAAVVAVTA